MRILKRNSIETAPPLASQQREPCQGCLIAFESQQFDTPEKLFILDQICLLGNLDHVGVNERLQHISVEMFRLLDEQRSWLNSGAKLAEMGNAEIDEHVERNRRLLRLAKELGELTSVLT